MSLKLLGQLLIVIVYSCQSLFTQFGFENDDESVKYFSNIFRSNTGYQFLRK